MYLTRSKNPRKSVKLSKLAYVAECRRSLRKAPDVHLQIFANADDTIQLVMSSGNPDHKEHMTSEVIPVTWYREELAGKKDHIREAVAHFKNYVRF